MSDEAVYPCARIRPVGRWKYNIKLMLGDGVEYGPGMDVFCFGWYRYGRGRAERKGLRELRRFARKQQRDEETWEVTE